jgi:glycosyltransferase involved in cell wall biosynthesis
MFCQAYNLTVLFLDKIKPGVLLTNSKFTQQIVRKYLNRDALVLHPPIAVKAYASKNVKRKNYVVTVSKFTPKRSLHKVPLIARYTRNAKFIIAGAADEYSSKTIQNLRKVISQCDVENRVTILPNISRSMLIELLTQAKAYLHVMPFEHFGISIIEAMAAGCVPIVHRSGGPWLDILDQQQGRNGFSYTTLEEAAQIVDLIMTDEKLSNNISSAAQKRAWDYDISVFQKRLTVVVNKLASQNQVT